MSDDRPTIEQMLARGWRWSRLLRRWVRPQLRTVHDLGPAWRVLVDDEEEDMMNRGHDTPQEAEDGGGSLC